MDLVTIILFAIGLAMDCLAVSISKGLTSKEIGNQKVWRGEPLLMALLFGAFQGIMPLIGYYTGSVFTNLLGRFAQWIALGLLVFIGGKMVWESLQHKEDGNWTDWSFCTLLILSIANSMDALVTGIVFIPYPESLWLGISIIALVAFVLSIVGYLIGVSVGNKFELNVELFGGLILIAIGLKIFLKGICF